MSKSSGDSKNTLYCSFCGKSQHEVRKLIAGPTVFICDECVELCMDIIREENKSAIAKSRSGVPTPSEINEVLDYVRGSLERLAEQRDIGIELQPLDGPAYVLGEREGLVQVFENLVNNAIKYGQEGGFVRIVAGREGGKEPMVNVAVIDNGPGIPEEHLPRLTERFYRVNVADSRDRGGTGLGLAIVKHVLNRHRGQLRIVSKPGEGSRFTVLLPEHKQASGKHRTDAASPAEAPIAPPRESAENFAKSIS